MITFFVLVIVDLVLSNNKMRHQPIKEISKAYEHSSEWNDLEIGLAIGLTLEVVIW